MKGYVGTDKKGRVVIVGGSCKARDLRGQITDIEEFLRRQQ